MQIGVSSEMEILHDISGEALYTEWLGLETDTLYISIFHHIITRITVTLLSLWETLKKEHSTQDGKAQKQEARVPDDQAAAMQTLHCLTLCQCYCGGK